MTNYHPMSAKKSGPNVAFTFHEVKSACFKGKCNFCHKFRHKKMDCRKLNAYLKKKCNPLVKVYSKSNIIDMPTNS